MICHAIEVAVRTTFKRGLTIGALDAGAFMICAFDAAEWALRSQVLEDSTILRANAWTPAMRWVLDLQTGEGAMVCPSASGTCSLRWTRDEDPERPIGRAMLRMFLRWWYAHPEHHDDPRTLPAYLELDACRERDER
jgi:hypothetical protein